MMEKLKFLAIGLVVGAFSAFFVARDYYKNDAKIAALTVQNAVLTADLTIMRAAEVRATQSAEIIAKASKTNEEILNEIINDLESRPQTDGCRLSGADAERLRRIQ